MLLPNSYVAMVLQKSFIQSALATSQSGRILERLQAAHGEEVGMAELSRIGAGDPTGWCMVHSRIADLRKRGQPIPKARVQRQPDGAMHSFYRLLTPFGIPPPYKCSECGAGFPTVEACLIHKLEHS